MATFSRVYAVEGAQATGYRPRCGEGWAVSVASAALGVDGDSRVGSALATVSAGASVPVWASVWASAVALALGAGSALVEGSALASALVLAEASAEDLGVDSSWEGPRSRLSRRQSICSAELSCLGAGEAACV